MTDEEIEKLVRDFDISDANFRIVVHLCKEVERRTRHRYQSLISQINSAAGDRTFTEVEMRKILWNAEQEKNSVKGSEGGSS